MAHCGQMAPGKRRRDTSWLPTVVPTVEALVDRGNRWDPLPNEGTLDELVDVMNHDLGAWAAEWPEPPA
jgi:hypothetical protein